MELFLFRFQNVLYDLEVISELGILRHIPYMHVHNFGKWNPDIKVVHHA